MATTAECRTLLLRAEAAEEALATWKALYANLLREHDAWASTARRFEHDLTAATVRRDAAKALLLRVAKEKREEAAKGIILSGSASVEQFEHGGRWHAWDEIVRLLEE